MVKVWQYILVPVAVFLVGVLIFFRVLNQGAVDLTTEMAEATLPIVYLTADGERVNELHGYTEEMDSTSMRDTITPVEIGGTLPISIDTYGYEIDTISYEVRSLDAERLVQQSEAENLSVEDEVLTADLPIQNLLTPQEEYLLILQITGSGDPCYFYTRIVENEESAVSECISFVRNFHEITMSKTRQSELEDYMETASDEDNDTLQTVTLRNSLSQVGWGDFRGAEATTPVVSIQEIGEAYNVILLTYVLSSTDEQDKTGYYNVKEYYRVRKGEERIYLLDFERTVEEIFRGETGGEESDRLVLGIRSPEVNYMTNESGTVVSFVQQGELWNCDLGSDALTRIFSFRSSGAGIDARENYGEHDIRIIRTNENGSVDFAVCGYMNRGDHEGKVGVSVCHYDSTTNTVEEMIFLPSAESYQVLRTGIGQEMYFTDDGQFYIVMGDQAYCVNPDTGEYSVVISDMAEGNYAFSADGRYLAWTEGNPAEAQTLHLIDLETGRSSDIEAPAGYRIRPLGFLDSDCVYGLAAEKNVSVDSSVFPMSRVVVVDFSNPDMAVLKTYESTDAYVTGAEVHDGNIYLERMTYMEGRYIPAGDDVIYNRDMQDPLSVTVTEIYSDIKETEVAFLLPQAIAAEPETAESKLIRPETTIVRLFDEMKGNTYYVYAKGGVILGTDSLDEAVQSAYADHGVVIGKNQVCVWDAAADPAPEAEEEIVVSEAEADPAPEAEEEIVVSEAEADEEESYE